MGVPFLCLVERFSYVSLGIRVSRVYRNRKNLPHYRARVRTDTSSAPVWCMYQKNGFHFLLSEKIEIWIGLGRMWMSPSWVVVCRRCV